MKVSAIAAIVAGGGVGAGLRYELALHLAPPTPPDFPWVTFAINVTGCFLLGAVMTLLATTWARTRYVQPFLATGAIGGFTTWSHFITESDQLISAHETPKAVVYMIVSLGLGIAAAALGAALVETATGRRGPGKS